MKELKINGITVLSMILAINHTHIHLYVFSILSKVETFYIININTYICIYIDKSNISRKVRVIKIYRL